MEYKIKDSLILATVACLLTACGGGGGSSDGSSSGNSAEPRPTPVTRTFANTGFTEVEINNSFEFIVQQGDHFAVEVTVDSDDIDLVRVSQDGVRLRVEFDPEYRGDIRTQVTRGIITLPVLDKISMTGSAFADVAGFAQSYLEVVQNGSSRIEGANCRIDMVTAVLGGNSSLTLEDVAAMAAGHVEASGSSHTTLNLMNGATLTGSASGSSNISYYGNDVSVQVTTTGTASVTRLGASRS